MVVFYCSCTGSEVTLNTRATSGCVCRERNEVFLPNSLESTPGILFVAAVVQSRLSLAQLASVCLSGQERA